MRIIVFSFLFLLSQPSIAQVTGTGNTIRGVVTGANSYITEITKLVKKNIKKKNQTKSPECKQAKSFNYTKK